MRIRVLVGSLWFFGAVSEIDASDRVAMRPKKVNVVWLVACFLFAVSFEALLVAFATSAGEVPNLVELLGKVGMLVCHSSAFRI